MNELWKTQTIRNTDEKGIFEGSLLVTPNYKDMVQSYI